MTRPSVLFALLTAIAACVADPPVTAEEGAATGSGSGTIKHGYMLTGATGGWCASETDCVCETTIREYASLTCDGAHTDVTIPCGQTQVLSHCEDYYCASFCKARNPYGCHEDCYVR